MADEMTAEKAGAFFHTYSEAFAAYDLDRVMDHHDHPLTVVTAAGPRVFPEREQARAFLGAQMEAYRHLGMAWPVPAAAITVAYNHDLVRAEVRWILRSRDGEGISGWTTIYLLRRSETGWKLAIVVSPEEPQALAALGTPGPTSPAT
ncbi:hypothetical protein [Rhodocista pekingensis]|uniref:DUF6841 domain-containing protein n=1 Tax=Rhodocista pekingensis TaxID=201185 RepID=A0ABW2KT15_9PROT